MIKRAFTADDRMRIRAAFELYSREHDLYQHEVAGLLGISQAALSNYLNPDEKNGIPLNTDFVLAAAKLMKVEPHQLAPSLPVKFVEDCHA